MCSGISDCLFNNVWCDYVCIKNCKPKNLHRLLLCLVTHASAVVGLYIACCGTMYSLTTHLNIYTLSLHLAKFTSKVVKMIPSQSNGCGCVRVRYKQTTNNKFVLKCMAHL